MLMSALRVLVKNYCNAIVLMASHKKLYNKIACVNLF